MQVTHHHVTLEEVHRGEPCPLPTHVIPNYMGINLCSVAGFTWTKRADGQLVSFTIEFLPESRS